MSALSGPGVLIIAFMLLVFPFITTMATGGATGRLLAHTSAGHGILIGLLLGPPTTILGLCAGWLPVDNPPWENLIPLPDGTVPMAYWASAIIAGTLNTITTMTIINKLRERSGKRELAE